MAIPSRDADIRVVGKKAVDTECQERGDLLSSRAELRGVRRCPEIYRQELVLRSERIGVYYQAGGMGACDEVTRILDCEIAAAVQGYEETVFLPISVWSVKKPSIPSARNTAIS